MDTGEILIYQNAEGTIKIDVRLDEETVWLTQGQMAQLFGKDKRTVSEHIRNIFKEGELQEDVVVRNFRITTPHGAIPNKTQASNVNLYNLDVIISVGYRVKSQQGTQFRIWATQRLREYIIKGFTLNDERFKSGSFKSKYFDFYANAQYPLIMKQQSITDSIIKDLFGVSGNEFNEIKEAISGLKLGELILKNPTAFELGMGNKYKKIQTTHLI